MYAFGVSRSKVKGPARIGILLLLDVYKRAPEDS